MTSCFCFHIITCFNADDSDAADLWLLNSCTVKNPSEDNFRNAIKKAQELDKHLVVAGCVPQGQPKHHSIKGISVIGVWNSILFIFTNPTKISRKRKKKYRRPRNANGNVVI